MELTKASAEVRPRTDFLACESTAGHGRFAPADRWVGRTLGHYRILERLPGGGMGEVYKAEDPWLRRPVAIKILPATNDDNARRRFLQEARAASTLDHPNICTVHQLGECEDGSLFIVMTYYEGETLRRRLELAGALEPLDALFVAIQVVEGLEEAHRQGLVHRDVTPANLILTPTQRVKIIDFGLVRLLADDPGITKPFSTVGTIAYMSPEQTRGAPTDGRTDIWSVGVILCEMLFGVHPFRADHAEATIYAIRNDPPRLPEEPSSPVPPCLLQIAMKTLEKAPARRYESASAMLAALRTARGCSALNPDEKASSRSPAGDAGRGSVGKAESSRRRRRPCRPGPGLGRACARGIQLHRS
jgi:serine/threonine protein kinase